MNKLLINAYTYKEGTAEQVRKFTTEDALRFTRKLYRPDNAIFFGCDEHDVKHCLRLVRKELDKFMQKPLFDENRLTTLIFK